jgi:hypothetical protein
MSSRRSLVWERQRRRPRPARAGEIAERYLFRPAHWSVILDQLSRPIRTCLDRIGPADDPRITGIRELDDGSLVIRVAVGEARQDCVLSNAGAVTALSAVAGDDVWPGEGDALFYPDGSRFGPTGETVPPVDRCEESRWFRTPDGDLAGWIVRQVCW